MAEHRKYSVPMLIARAFSMGLVLMMAVPVVTFLAVLALAHLLGGCGAGSSGGCEMGAAIYAIIAVIPGFIIGSVVSVWRDLRQSKA